MRGYTGRGMELKRNNKMRIAEYISQSASVSKAEIASGLDISMPTVLQNVKELIAAGLVEETGEYESTGGRKAKALAIRRDAGYTVGVDATNNHITFVMADARRDIISSERVRQKYSDSGEYEDMLISMIKKFISRQKIDSSRIAGIGFSVPGIVDKEQKLLLRSHTLQVQNISLRPIGDALGYPYSVGNDASSAAYAELGSENENAVYLSLSSTVGGAVRLHGQFYEGEQLKSAEFGHMVIEKGGRKCYCGKEGCLDAYCAAQVLQEQSGMNLEQFFEKVRQKDKKILKIWDEYLDYLAVGVTNLRMIFDCRIVLGGYVGGYMEEFLPDLYRKVKLYNNFDADVSYLYAGKYKYNASAFGAALTFTDSILERGQA